MGSYTTSAALGCLLVTGLLFGSTLASAEESSPAVEVAEPAEDPEVQRYRELIAADPHSPYNPEHQGEIINHFLQSGQFDRARTETERLVEDYGRSSAWARANKTDPSSLEEAKVLIEQQLRDLAIGCHRQALEQKSASLLKKAELDYMRYLQHFPQGHRSYEMRFWYARILEKFKQDRFAAEQLEMVVLVGPTGKLFKKATESGFRVLERVTRHKEGVLAILGTTDDSAIIALLESAPPKPESPKESEEKARLDEERTRKSNSPLWKRTQESWEQSLIKISNSYADALPSEAALFFESRCTENGRWGCFALAGMYLQGKGVPQNKRKAKELYRKSCDSKLERACGKL